MKIVMDDAGDIPMDLAQKYDVRIIPINIMFGTEQFLSRVEMDHDAFYKKTTEVTADNFPKTSQPTPYQFVEFYKEILAEGETDILTVTVSEKLSGTYASAVQARKELEGQANFYLFDSQAGSAAQGYMALEAARMAHDGADIDTIMATLEKMRDSMSVVFTIDSLEYAVKGGRVSTMKSLVASLLNIKPILRLNDGLIVEAGRVRTRKRALDHIVDVIYQDLGDQPIRLVVIHANAPDDAKILQEKARARFNIAEELFADIAVAVAINLCPGALGLIAFPAE
jgi:DegV family protein with EDD domain